MSHPLTPNQFALLARVEAAALSASTLRTHSELRWLEHLGLVAVNRDGRFAITADGLARMAGEAGNSRIDA